MNYQTYEYLLSESTNHQDKIIAFNPPPPPPPPGQNDKSKCIFERNDRIPIRITLKFVPMSPIDNKPALVQVIDWRRRGDTPLPEPMLA